MPAGYDQLSNQMTQNIMAIGQAAFQREQMANRDALTRSQIALEEQSQNIQIQQLALRKAAVDEELKNGIVQRAALAQKTAFSKKTESLAERGLEASIVDQEERNKAAKRNNSPAQQLLTDDAMRAKTDALKTDTEAQRQQNDFNTQTKEIRKKEYEAKVAQMNYETAASLVKLYALGGTQDRATALAGLQSSSDPTLQTIGKRLQAVSGSLSYDSPATNNRIVESIAMEEGQKNPVVLQALIESGIITAPAQLRQGYSVLTQMQKLNADGAKNRPVDKDGKPVGESVVSQKALDDLSSSLNKMSTAVIKQNLLKGVIVDIKNSDSDESQKALALDMLMGRKPYQNIPGAVDGINSSLRNILETYDSERFVSFKKAEENKSKKLDEEAIMRDAAKPDNFVASLYASAQMRIDKLYDNKPNSINGDPPLLFGKKQAMLGYLVDFQNLISNKVPDNSRLAAMIEDKTPKERFLALLSLAKTDPLLDGKNFNELSKLVNRATLMKVKQTDLPGVK